MTDNLDKTHKIFGIGKTAAGFVSALFVAALLIGNSYRQIWANEGTIEKVHQEGKEAFAKRNMKIDKSFEKIYDEGKAAFEKRDLKIEEIEDDLEEVDKTFIEIKRDGQARDKDIEHLKEGQTNILNKIEKSEENVNASLRDLLNEIRKQPQ